jgi:squalene-associated FAD-dependent desaturase
LAPQDLGEPREGSRLRRREIARLVRILIKSPPMPSSQTTVAIAGGGLAGLAAACALSDAGFRVTLYEKRPFLGGRASSYEHPGTSEVVDNCQHVLFRLCTNLVEFYGRIGVANQIRWFDRMNFIEPGGRISVMKSSLLPAPMHTAPSFFRFSFLSVADKLAITRALARLTMVTQRDTGQSFQQWLDQHGQTKTAVSLFWRPILVSALSEDLERISISSAAQVIRESMRSRPARQMGVPMIPLTDLYSAAGDYVRARGGEIHFRCSLESFATEKTGVRVRVADSEPTFDYLIAALPFDALSRVLPEAPASVGLREKIGHFENSPITGIHLWFDQQISDLDHAVLLDRTIQWMFHKSRLQPMRTQESAAPAARAGVGPSRAENGSYIELVVSSSKTLIEKSRREIVELALGEVREFFPAARAASVVKSTVIKEINATYSPRPGIDAHRPAATTEWPRVFLAGDWTATGWPATMEGAVRSGYLASEALTRQARTPAQYISPDLPATGLMRLFG